MVQRFAPSGISLQRLANVSNVFHSVNGTLQTDEDNGARLGSVSPALEAQVKELCNKISDAMAQDFSGNPAAVDTFRDALKVRSSLLSDPAVKQQGNGDLAEFVKNVVHIADDGDPKKSLRLTVDMHGKALDPNYTGEEPVVKAPPPKDDQPALGLGGS